MNINKLRNELSIRAEKGLSFIIAATIIWPIIVVIFISSHETRIKNI